MLRRVPRLRTVLLGCAMLFGLAAGSWWTLPSADAQGGMPGAPDIHTITPLHQGLRVYWWPPGRDGGTALTGYDVHYRASGVQAWTDAGHSGLSQPAAISGLRFDATYEVRVRARNANGAGPWSIVDSRRTARDDGRPDPPLPPTLTPGDGEIAVSWQSPAYTGARPISGYRVRYTSDDGDTWRTWSSGGSSLITGTSATITGLDNDVLTGVIVAAENSRGRSTWSAHTAEAVPVGALSLTLESSRDLCTANTLTELSWTITGGVPPYTLTIEGEKVDSNAESHRVNCGPLQIDPQTEEPLPNQKREFSANVNDSRLPISSSVATVMVGLARPLAPPSDLSLSTFPERVSVTWSDDSEEFRTVNLAGEEAGVVIRYRPLRSVLWTYSQRVSRFPGTWLQAETGEHVLQATAVRSPIELQTPAALVWGQDLRFARPTAAQNVVTVATHDTIVVSWDRQPLSRASGIVSLRSPDDDYLTRGFQEDGNAGRQEIAFSHLPPDTEFVLTTYVQGSDHGGPVTNNTYASTTIRTQSPPPGWQAPQRVPQNLRASATANSITIDWEPPFAGAEEKYLVQVFETSTGVEIDSRSFHDGTRTWTTGGRYWLVVAGFSYRVRVLHRAIPQAEASVIVTVASGGGVQGQGTATTPTDPWEEIWNIPFRPIWPVSVNANYDYVDDPYKWRLEYQRDRSLDSKEKCAAYKRTHPLAYWGPDNNQSPFCYVDLPHKARYHAGLDIGADDSLFEYHRAEEVRGDAVVAAEAGQMRLYNNVLAEENLVYYCPQVGGRLTDQFITHRDQRRGSLGCDNSLLGPSSGRTILIFHDGGLGRRYVTKYAHLQAGSIPAELLVALGVDPACDAERLAAVGATEDQACKADPARAVHVKKGTVIGAVGSSQYLQGSGASEHSFSDVHLHFEIRYFDGTDYDSWYKADNASGCSARPPSHCGWTSIRKMDTVEDVERHLPPLPASWVPTDPGGHSSEEWEPSDPLIRKLPANRHVIEVVGTEIVAGQQNKPDALKTQVSAAFWRPLFYSRYFLEPPRTATHGIAGTRSGVDRYFVASSCQDAEPTPAPGPVTGDPAVDRNNEASPAGELPRQMVILDLNQGDSCIVDVLTGNWSYPEPIRNPSTGRWGVHRSDIELRDPSALIAWAANLEASVDEQTLPGQQLAGNAINLYTFVGHRGHTYQFCTIPPAPKAPEPGVCTDETSAANTAELLLVGPSGAIPDGIANANGLSWTVPASAPPEATYTLVVRRRDRERQANPSPTNYKFALRYTVPLINKCGSLSGISGQGGPVVRAVAATTVCEPPLPTNVRVTSQTDDSLTVAWDGVDGATKYELKAITTTDCEADQTPDDQLKSTTDTTYPYLGLEADTDYTICVRAERVIGSARSALTIRAAWASGYGRTLAEDRLPQPTKLRVVERTSGTLTVRWDGPAGTQSYQLRTDEDDTTITSANDFAGTRSHRLTGLSSARGYKVQVQSLQGALTSEWTMPITVYTSLPTPVIDANQVSATAETASFAWGEVTGANRYEVRRVPDGRTEEKRANALRHEFSGLTPNTPYQLSVRATLVGNSEVTSAWASTTKTTQPPDPSLKTLALSGVSFNFDPAVTSYSPTVDHDLSRTTVTATPNHSNASLVIAPDDADTNTDAHEVRLSAGATTITVTVSHAGATRVYTVTVTRTAPLVLTASADLTTCESGGTVVVSWTIGGGATPYTVSVTGAADVTTSQATGSANYVCPQTAGAASVSVSVRDAGGQRASKTLNLTVNAKTPQLKITSASTTWTHCEAGRHQVPVDWSASGGKPPYAAAGTRIDADSVTLLCPAAGAALTLAVTDSSSPPQAATADVSITATEPLSLSARAESLSCEQGGQATIIWTVSGGAGPYQVSVGGRAQQNTSRERETQNRRTAVACGEAGSQIVSLSAADASQPNRLVAVGQVTLTVTEPPPLAPLPKPDGFSVAVTPVTATLSWNKVANADDYRVRACLGTSTNCVYGATTSLSHPLPNLNPGTEYTFGVQARSASRPDSDWETLKETMALAKPEPHRSAANTHTVTVSWNSVPGADRYQIKECFTCAEVLIRTTSRTMTNLAYGASFTFSARAGNSRVWSDWAVIRVEVPAIVVTARVEARLLSNGRVEFGFRPQGGAQYLPDQRFVTPAGMTAGRWLNSSAVYQQVDEVRRNLGRISVSLNTTSGSRPFIDVRFTPTGSERLSDNAIAKNHFFYQDPSRVVTGRWYWSDYFTFELRSSVHGGSGGESGESMEAAGADETFPEDVEGGSMGTE
ncbi:MAG: fibronectin type III domain-containing protein [Chloroflexi bacterium]|nr:fibronectin type III domain-containing protein [Chloroflexota bacterium]